MQPRSGGTVWDSKRFSHHHQGKTHVVMEDEHRPLVERELPEGALQLIAVGDALDVVHRARQIGWQDANG